MNIVHIISLIDKLPYHKNISSKKNIKTYLSLQKIASLFHSYIIYSILLITSIVFLKMHTQASYKKNSDSIWTEIIATKEIENALPHKIITTKQELKQLARSKKLGFAFYKILPGENLSSIANKFGLSIATVLSLNSLDNSHSIVPGQKILLSTISGIIFTTKEDQTIESIAEKYHISPEKIKTVNELDNRMLLRGKTLFLPDANLPLTTMVELLGFQFMNPIPHYSYLSSGYGWRWHPQLKRKKLHTGIDLAAPIGTPIKAAKEGRVIFSGWKNGLGLTVIIRHNNGFSTVYGHQSGVIVQNGVWVEKGQKIGFVGNTGISTGPHLHFEIRKYGQAKNPLFNGLKLR